MASNTAVSITTPVGRLVAGSLYKFFDKDIDGKQLVVKNGPNAGQPRVQYFVGIAIPKAPGETHFAQTEWGAKIWQVGHQAFPQAAQRPDFAWKIGDGDSTIPNKNGKKPCENEGWPGHWIIKLTSGFALKVYRMEGNDPVIEQTPDFIKPGYYVQAFFSADGNGSQQTPGVYLNPQAVCFRAYGPEINFGLDVSEAGFGAAALPAGATAAPVGGVAAFPTVAGSSAAPVPPSVTAATPMNTAVPAVPSAGVPVGSAPVPVVPNPAFLQVPPPNAPATGVAAVNALGHIAPAPPISTSPSKTMTAKAAGATYEQFAAQGWTDAKMIADGYLILS